MPTINAHSTIEAAAPKARKVRKDKGVKRGPRTSKSPLETAKDSQYVAEIRAKVAQGKKDAAAKKAATKKTAEKNAEPRPCHCGCGETTNGKSYFRQGHDARFYGRVKKVIDGRLSFDDVLAVIQDYAVDNYRDAIKDRRSH